MQRVTRHRQDVFVLRCRHFNKNIRVRLKAAIRVVYGYEALTDVASSVRDDRCRRLRYMSMPDLVWPRVPGDRHGLTVSESTNFRLVEVSDYPQMLQVRDRNQVVARIDQIKA